MRFNRNVSLDDMKERISAKIVRYCGRRISKLFYKFPSDQNAPIQLFAELAGVEPAEDPTSLVEEHRAQELCIVVPISYVDSQSTVRGIDIDLNAALETNVVGDDIYNSSDPFDYKVDSDSDPDPDESGTIIDIL
ncbi:hypothetical protein GOBAR_DD15537 [Gossypium barbadense]|nr:hypothetical protein GOBAR_DD15537 [Gossypium barbadense]